LNFEPQKFFVGLIDFLSILMPGALLTYIVGDCAWARVFRGERLMPTETEGWVVFLFASYLLGHFIFLMSTWIDAFYGLVSDSTLKTQIKQLAWHGRLMPWWRLTLLWLVFKQDRDIAVDCVGRIKKQCLDRIGGTAAMNNFQWSKARLAIEHPESLAAVQRFEANSKFFRSLVVVFGILILWYCEHSRFDLAGGCAFLLVLSLWRYMEQRHKATNQAYWSVITLDGKNATLTIPTAKPEPDHPTHAGGVLLQGKGKDREVLMVQATVDANEWVLPKGHIELGEHPRETAVREVHEETGVWAKIVETTQTLNYKVRDETVRVQYFIMQAIQTGMTADQFRKHKWFSLIKAIDQTRDEDLKNLLKLVGETEI